MRTIMKKEDRRNEILDVAGELFNRKGFDGTSTNEILEQAGIARGTLYYHFKSKEDIMDALIERQSTEVFAVIREIAGDRNIPLQERMLRVILALHLDTEDNEENKELMAHIHKPQNALMHQKIQRTIIQNLTPILAEIIKEGVEQGLFHTPYPYECMEMLVVYAGTVFDDNDVVVLAPEQEALRLKALFFNIERMLGAKSGSLFSEVIKMYEKSSEGDGNTTKCAE